jgi:hypothetical protein
VGDERERVLGRLTAEWSLERLNYDALPAAASRLLELDLDTPRLRQLAGQDTPSYWSTHPLFERMMEELSIEKPPPLKARRMLAVEIAHAIVSGGLAPVEGARRIGGIWSEVMEEDSLNDLSIFTGLWSEWDDWHLRDDGGDYPQKLENQIVENARKLIQQYPNRLPLA